MRFPIRQQITAQNAAERVVPEYFIESLEQAIAEADRFITIGRFKQKTIQHWQDSTATKMLEQHALNLPIVNAVLGIAYGLAANAIIRRSQCDVAAFRLGSDGQRRMTMAFLGLHKDDASLYLSTKRAEISVLMAGAYAVANLAGAITDLGGICYFTTPEEDAEWRLDLLCEAEKTGACIQVKTGKSKVEHVINPGTQDEMHFISGTAHFNRKFSVKWIPITAIVPPHFSRKPATYLAKMREHADAVLTVMKYSTEK